MNGIDILEGAMKVYLNLKFHKLLILPILFVFSIVAFNNQTENIVTAKEATIPTEGFPSTPAPIWAIIWMNSGFSKPLKEVISATIDNTNYSNNIIPISNSFIKSSLTLPSASGNYTWYKKIDDGAWKVSDSGYVSALSVNSNRKFNTSLNLLDFKNLHSKKIITVKYQLAYILGVFSKDRYYSRIITVHILPTNVNAKSITIETDNDYLYNNKNNDLGTNVTYARATTDPEFATAQPEWSVSDESKATIDSNGEITAKPTGSSANDSNQISSFFVYAKIKNADGTIVTASKLMNVGGGLYDQKARAGERATFVLQGFDNSTRDSFKTDVKWYKKKGKNGKPSSPLPKQDDPFRYTTEPLTKDDDGDYYYATIKMTYGNNDTQSLTTNDALLTVNPALNPNVKLTNQVENVSSKSDQDTPLILNDIVNNDLIDYKFQLNNDGERDLNNTTLSTYLSLGTEIVGVNVDGTDLTDSQYSTTAHINNRNQLLQINIGSLKINDKRNIIVHTLTHDIDRNFAFAATPFFIGTDDDQNDYQSIGSKFKLNYLNNELIPHIKTINFEPIYPFDVNADKYRLNSTNSPNEIITFEDHRKKKNPLKVYLNEPDNLIDTHNNSLAAIFKFKNDTSPYPQPIKDKVLVAQSAQDQTLQPIRWDKDKGLLLHVTKSNIIAGEYHTKLSWSIQDSV